MEPDWKAMFYDLLDGVEQIPHPMAEELWQEFSEEPEDDEDEEDEEEN